MRYCKLIKTNRLLPVEVKSFANFTCCYVDVPSCNSIPIIHCHRPHPPAPLPPCAHHTTAMVLPKKEAWSCRGRERKDHMSTMIFMLHCSRPTSVAQYCSLLCDSSCREQHLLLVFIKKNKRSDKRTRARHRKALQLCLLSSSEGESRFKSSSIYGCPESIFCARYCSPPPFEILKLKHP